MSPIERALRVGMEEVVSDLSFLYTCLSETNSDLAPFVKDSHGIAMSYLVTSYIHEANLIEEKKHASAFDSVRSVVAHGSQRLPASEDGPVSETDPAAAEQA